MALSMRSLKVSVGSAAKAGTSTPVISKFRSGIDLSFRYPGFCPNINKKRFNGLPDRVPSAQTLPATADQADELITGIDRDNVIFAPILYPVDEQRLHVGFQLVQNRVVVDKRAP